MESAIYTRLDLSSYSEAFVRVIQASRTLADSFTLLVQVLESAESLLATPTPSTSRGRVWFSRGAPVVRRIAAVGNHPSSPPILCAIDGKKGDEDSRTHYPPQRCLWLREGDGVLHYLHVGASAARVREVTAGQGDRLRRALLLHEGSVESLIFSCLRFQWRRVDTLVRQLRVRSLSRCVKAMSLGNMRWHHHRKSLLGLERSENRRLNKRMVQSRFLAVHHSVFPDPGRVNNNSIATVQPPVPLSDLTRRTMIPFSVEFLWHSLRTVSSMVHSIWRVQEQQKAVYGSSELRHGPGNINPDHIILLHTSGPKLLTDLTHAILRLTRESVAGEDDGFRVTATASEPLRRWRRSDQVSIPAAAALPPPPPPPSLGENVEHILAHTEAEVWRFEEWFDHHHLAKDEDRRRLLTLRQPTQDDSVVPVQEWRDIWSRVILLPYTSNRFDGVLAMWARHRALPEASPPLYQQDDPDLAREEGLLRLIEQWVATKREQEEKRRREGASLWHPIFVLVKEPENSVSPTVRGQPYIHNHCGPLITKVKNNKSGDLEGGYGSWRGELWHLYQNRIPLPRRLVRGQQGSNMRRPPPVILYHKMPHPLKLAAVFRDLYNYHRYDLIHQRVKNKRKGRNPGWGGRWSLRRDHGSEETFLRSLVMLFESRLHVREGHASPITLTSDISQQQQQKQTSESIQNTLPPPVATAARASGLQACSLPGGLAWRGCYIPVFTSVDILFSLTKGHSRPSHFCMMAAALTEDYADTHLVLAPEHVAGSGSLFRDYAARPADRNHLPVHRVLLSSPSKGGEAQRQLFTGMLEWLQGSPHRHLVVMTDRYALRTLRVSINGNVADQRFRAPLRLPKARARSGAFGLHTILKARGGLRQLVRSFVTGLIDSERNGDGGRTLNMRRAYRAMLRPHPRTAGRQWLGERIPSRYIPLLPSWTLHHLHVFMERLCEASAGGASGRIHFLSDMLSALDVRENSETVEAAAAVKNRFSEKIGTRGRVTGSLLDLRPERDLWKSLRKAEAHAPSVMLLIPYSLNDLDRTNESLRSKDIFANDDDDNDDNDGDDGKDRKDAASRYRTYIDNGQMIYSAANCRRLLAHDELLACVRGISVLKTERYGVDG